MPTPAAYVTGGSQINTFFWAAINANPSSGTAPNLPGFLRVQLVWASGTTGGQAVISMDIIAKP